MTTKANRQGKAGTSRSGTGKTSLLLCPAPSFTKTRPVKTQTGTHTARLPLKFSIPNLSGKEGVLPEIVL
jgi:hypothetical protein